MGGNRLISVPKVSLFNVVLNEDGELSDRGVAVKRGSVERWLASNLRIPKDVTDIFVFVHGWRNSARSAQDKARMLFGGVRRVAEMYGPYPGMREFKPWFIVIRWPSMTPIGKGAFLSTMDRAHRMTTKGQAARVLGHLLGYLHESRTVPLPSRNVLKNRDGQFVHCVGHSLGGHFLGEAIKWAAKPPRATTLARRWNSPHPFAVDSLTVFQMAARRDVFDTQFGALQGKAPLCGPVVLTFAGSDRAVGRWQRWAEGAPGIGAAGALPGKNAVSTIRLKPVPEPYTADDFLTRIVNVDAAWLFGSSAPTLFSGSHSDFLYEESAHLLLSVAGVVRKEIFN